MADSPETKIDIPSHERGHHLREAPRRLFLALVSLLLLAALCAYMPVPWRPPNKGLDDSADFHWQQALHALKADDFLQAKTHLARCLEVWPINAEAHFLMARACRRSDDNTGWQVHLRRAEVLGWDKDPLDLERDLMRAQLGNLPRVENSLLDRLDSRPPEEEIILEALAKGYLKTHQLDTLLELTRTWIDRYPDHWQPRLFRGRLFQLGRSTAQAIVEYRHVLQLKPDHLSARLELANALMVDAQFQDALEHFQTYLQRCPEEPDAQVGLANCQFSLGQFEAAQVTLAELFSRHKDHAAGFFVRGKLELALNQPQEALHWLRRAEALAPHETDITYNLVLALQRLGRQEEAKKYEQKLQDIRRQFDHLEGIKKQILRNPRSVTLRQEAGAVALRLGRDQEAMHWLGSALQLDPNHAPTHKLLADFYEKLGDGQRAAEHRRQAEAK